MSDQDGPLESPHNCCELYDEPCTECGAETYHSCTKYRDYYYLVWYCSKCDEREDRHVSHEEIEGNSEGVTVEEPGH